MNTRNTSLIVRASLIALGSAAALGVHAGNAADASSDAQSIARGLLSGTSAHVVTFVANAAATPAAGPDFDAQQHAARLLSGRLNDSAAANARMHSVPRAASRALTARNGDLQAAARRLLQGQSLD
jgi:hypothetical protein